MADNMRVELPKPVVPTAQDLQNIGEVVQAPRRQSPKGESPPPSQELFPIVRGRVINRKAGPEEDRKFEIR